MRILVLHRRGLQPLLAGALADGPRHGSLTAAEALALDIERNTALARALARRGHEVHVLANDLEVPPELCPATVHEWRSFGTPLTLEHGVAPYNLHLALPGAERGSPGETPFTDRLAEALWPDVVVADLRVGDADFAAALAARAGAALVLRVPPFAGEDATALELERALGAAAALTVPSATAERHLRHTGALGSLAPVALGSLAPVALGSLAPVALGSLAPVALGSLAPAIEVVQLADGLDAFALAPEPRGALPAASAPPLPHGMRCVLFDGDADEDPLGAALLRASADVLVRRIDIGLVLPSRGFVASEARARGSAARTHVFTLDPSERTARRALVRHARLVILPYEPGARSERRVAGCVARGVLPMARLGGADGEALAALSAQLPEDLARALCLPDEIEVDAVDLRRRVTAVLDHPDLPYIGARLAAVAAREHDWSVVAQRWERLLQRVVTSCGQQQRRARARSA